jgi:hypothetical protein
MALVSRNVFFILLVLMQVIAPWVHAHTGRETGGFWHVPGLEFLTGPGKGYAHFTGRPDGEGVLVGVQSGLRDWAGETGFSPDSGDQPGLAAASGPPARVSADRAAVTAIVSPPPIRPPFRKASPRAPPSTAARNPSR